MRDDEEVGVAFFRGLGQMGFALVPTFCQRSCCSLLACDAQNMKPFQQLRSIKLQGPNRTLKHLQIRLRTQNAICKSLSPSANQLNIRCERATFLEQDIAPSNHFTSIEQPPDIVRNLSTRYSMQKPIPFPFKSYSKQSRNPFP